VTYPPPPPYPPGPPNYGGGEHPQGTTILVLGILSLVLCSPLGIAAWVMGRRALAEAAAMGASNTSTIKAGYICGIIGSCLMILSVVFVVIVIIATVVAAPGASY
jgi:uncharacterized membrane protein YjgN (DUF898 family)